MLPSSITDFLQSYNARLIKANALYIVAAILFSALAIYFIPIQVRSYVSLKQELELLDLEITNLEGRREAILLYDGIDLDSLLIMLNTVLPNTEDGFSIRQVVANLESLSGMIFKTEVAPYNPAVAADSAINIQAVGTEDLLVNFLKNYHYKSGRIMTMSGFSIRKDPFKPDILQLNFAMAFHSREARAGGGRVTQVNQEALDFANELKTYFESRGASYTGYRIEDDDIPIEYPIRKDPFGN